MVVSTFCIGLHMDEMRMADFLSKHSVQTPNGAILAIQREPDSQSLLLALPGCLGVCVTNRLDVDW